MSVSWWNRGRATERLDADVCVIGAGICGLAAAVNLHRRGQRVVVLERRHIGAGASARNAGYLMRGAADNYAAACDAWGQATARQLWEWTEENLRCLRDLGIERLRSYRCLPSVLLAIDDEEAAALERSAALMRASGFRVELARDGRDVAWSPAGGGGRLGLVNPDDAAIDPAELLEYFDEQLPLKVTEATEVFGIEPSRARQLVRASGREGVLEVRARGVFVCTNAWARTLFPSLEVEPNRAQMLAMRVPQSIRLDANYYINHGHDYVRMPGPGLVVAGGRRHLHAQHERTDSEAYTRELQRDLESFTRRFIGAPDGEVLARWAGVMGLTPDGLPIAGEVAPGVVACVGFNGHGMSLAYRLSEVAVEAWLGTGAWPECLAPTRFSAKCAAATSAP